VAVRAALIRRGEAQGGNEAVEEGDVLVGEPARAVRRDREGDPSDHRPLGAERDEAHDVVGPARLQEGLEEIEVGDAVAGLEAPTALIEADRQQVVDDAALERAVLPGSVEQGLDGAGAVAPPFVGQGSESRVDGGQVEGRPPDRQARLAHSLANAGEQRSEVVVDGRGAQHPLDEIAPGIGLSHAAAP
jgi:hypothetical protein